MKTKFTMMMAVIATFAISLNLHSSNEEVVFGAPAVQMPRGGEKYCAFKDDWPDCKMGKKYFYKMSFVGREGLYISENNLENPQFDENKLVFTCFKIKNVP